MEKLWADEQQQPITYNHYYTDNVQKSRIDSVEKAINHAVDSANLDRDNYDQFGNISRDSLVAALQRQVNVDMDDQACSEAEAGLNAYYKVALHLQPILTSKS